jgi:hypothetical protein
LSSNIGPNLDPAGEKTVPKPAKHRRSARLPTPVIARVCQGLWRSANYRAAIHKAGVAGSNPAPLIPRWLHSVARGSFASLRPVVQEKCSKGRVEGRAAREERTPVVGHVFDAVRLRQPVLAHPPVRTTGTAEHGVQHSPQLVDARWSGTRVLKRRKQIADIRAAQAGKRQGCDRDSM